ncbi:uncharacterized protein [Vulpes vulpes]|uniref:Uncharacterized protein isoform X2 n=1 Tax=Vulpes vulpes TaxID=9627 RepID=A0ABM5A8E0_VULVU
MNQMTYRRTLPVPAPKCHTMAAFLKGISDHKSGSVFSFRQDRTFRIFNDRTVKQLCGLPFLGKPVMDAGKSKIKALANLMSGTNPFNKHLCTPAMYEALHLLLETHNQTSFHSCLQETQSLSSLVLIIGFFGEGLLKDRVRTGFWFGSTLLTTEMLMCKLYEHLFSASVVCDLITRQSTEIKTGNILSLNEEKRVCLSQDPNAAHTPLFSKDFRVNDKS